MADPVRNVPAHGVNAEFVETHRRHAERRTAPTFYELLGGADLCQDFARRVFAGVAADPVLRPWFGADLAGWERRLADSLAGYWRGTPAVVDPVLRWDEAAGARPSGSATRWSRLVDGVTDELDLPESLRSALRGCFRLVAERLVALPGARTASRAD